MPLAPPAAAAYVLPLPARETRFEKKKWVLSILISTTGRYKTHNTTIVQVGGGGYSTVVVVVDGLVVVTRGESSS
jgi:hypothetical protein